MPRPITTKEHNFREEDQMWIDVSGETFWTSRCICGQTIRAEDPNKLAEYKRGHYTMMAHALRRANA